MNRFIHAVHCTVKYVLQKNLESEKIVLFSALNNWLQTSLTGSTTRWRMHTKLCSSTQLAPGIDIRFATINTRFSKVFHFFHFYRILTVNRLSIWAIVVSQYVFFTYLSIYLCGLGQTWRRWNSGAQEQTDTGERTSGWPVSDSAGSHKQHDSHVSDFLRKTLDSA